MAFPGYLNADEINRLTSAALEGGLIGVPRATLLAGIRPGFVAGLAVIEIPLNQFINDLVAINQVERMAGGEVPLQTFLQNCSARLKLTGRAQAGEFDQALSKVLGLAAGVPPLPAVAGLPEVEKQEKILGIDNTLGVDFFVRGLKVAAAVARITVPRFENGVQQSVAGGPWLAHGTARLLSPSLLITNNHVLNSRMATEAAACDADFTTQALQSSVRFDFDTESAAGVKTGVRRLVARSVSLDYAVVELAEPVTRPVPRLAPDPVTVDATTRLAVNIVQHPRGEHKQVAFRNNLASGADERVLRYFTDTDHGSSGSPVCDDQWRVVALHRGAQHATGVEFQGRDDAYVNFGTQIRAVVADLAEQDQVAGEAVALAQQQN
jgi:hypothetical protein